jgi:hypothetical protein
VLEGPKSVTVLGATLANRDESGSVLVVANRH